MVKKDLDQCGPKDREFYLTAEGYNCNHQPMPWKSSFPLQKSFLIKHMLDSILIAIKLQFTKNGSKIINRLFSTMSIFLKVTFPQHSRSRMLCTTLVRS